MNAAENKKLDYIGRRLDTIIVILLTRHGLQRKQIAEVLGVSEKTVERLLAGNLAKIKTNRD